MADAVVPPNPDTGSRSSSDPAVCSCPSLCVMYDCTSVFLPCLPVDGTHLDTTALNGVRAVTRFNFELFRE